MNAIVPPFCHYEICRDGKMELCGADAPDVLDESGKVRCTGLCAEHAEFVMDSTRGPFTASKKAHPAGFNWLSKARTAYGIKPFSMGKPSDAGKPAHNPCTAAESAAWIAKMPRYNDGGEPVRTVEMIEARYQEIIAAEGNGTEPATVFTVEGLNGFTAHTVPSTPEPEPVDFAALEKEIHENVSAGLSEPAPIAQDDGPAADYTREEIEAACVRLMEERDTYRGTGIPGVLWNVGFRIVYQKRAGSDAQIAFIRALIAKKPEKYAPLLV
jgi:hypothetical protein